jgi:DNA replication protein DnaC
MIHLNKEDSQFLSFAKEEIITNHKECNGTGMLFDDYCQCQKIFNLVYRLKIFNIPMTSWFLDLKNFEFYKPYKKTLKEYIDFLEFESGVGFSISGLPNSGKTLLLSNIAISLILKGKYILYSKISDYNNNVYDIINKSFDRNFDAIIIDDITKEQLNPYVISIINSYKDYGKPVFLATREESELLKDLVGFKNTEIMFDELIEDFVSYKKDYFSERFIKLSNVLDSIRYELEERNSKERLKNG